MATDLDALLQRFRTAAELLTTKSAVSVATPAPHDLAALAQRYRATAAAAERAEHQGPPGPAGKPGAEGPPGPMPAHRWEGTALQFEQAPGGEWGEAVDLKGDRGEPGRRGSGGTQQAAKTQFSYWPAGW